MKKWYILRWFAMQAPDRRRILVVGFFIEARRTHGSKTG